MGYEIDFLSVGNSNGDAICIRYGNAWSGYRIQIVDGGYKDTGQQVIDHVKRWYDNPQRIDDIVLSHQDGDHAAGLVDVLKHFDVGTLWMNRPWLYAAELLPAFHQNFTVQGLADAIREAYPLLVELENIALSKGIPVREAFAYQRIGAFTVLAPTRERYLQLIPQFDRTPTSYARPDKSFFDKIVEAAKSLKRFLETWASEALEEHPAPTSASNECCVVQLGNFDGATALLTADAGPAALREAADVANSLGMLIPPTFVQVPHHGSRRNVTPSVLNRWLGYPQSEYDPPRGTAFCSVGENKPQYPRRRVSNAFLRRGYPVYKIENGGPGAYIRHANGMPDRAGMMSISPIQFTATYEE